MAYLQPGDYTVSAEKLEGEIRRNNLGTLREKWAQSGHLLQAEQIKTRATRLKINQAQNLYNKEAIATQRTHVEAQKEQVGLQIAQTGLQVANTNLQKTQLELGAARIETRLFAQQKQAQIEGKQMDLYNILAQNSEKRALYSLQGRLKNSPSVIAGSNAIGSLRG
ncbi:hypothetical protein [Okeania sp. SIO2B3]|uniref:hypothetical protein n=1 Tax=Okeania sp. SIO2B3 TaxID=2607784 RepID=UPI0013C1F8CF|nr:hypothetical protein [Okeania sp. SIO2B3]NET46634.1 hypothetical protein [Okeania sp. SIO2B3]